jgi:hypothetical protein
MKNNAIKFNGPEHPYSKEATAIYEFVRSEIADNRQELDAMAEAVEDQLSNKKGKRSKAARAKSPKSISTSGANVMLDGVSVNLGELSKDFVMLGSDSDTS